MRSDLYDLMVEIKAQTNTQILVSDGQREAWLPKSEVEIEPSEIGGIHIVTAPEWLLMDRGLV